MIYVETAVLNAWHCWTLHALSQLMGALPPLSIDLDYWRFTRPTSQLLFELVDQWCTFTPTNLLKRVSVDLEGGRTSALSNESGRI